MNGKSQQEKIILGLKVKQYRQDRLLSLAELSKRSGMSVSYINEIEKGKKFPKEDKLEALSTALEVPYEELVANTLPNKLEPVKELLESNFLNELPLELFKIELIKVIEIIANAPAQVSAFISTLIELSRNYAVQQESFYFAALRSYLELHDNYFSEIENKVEEFAIKYSLPTDEIISPERLAQLLQKQYGYKIIAGGLDQYPTLSSLRSVFIPQKKTLLLHSSLTEMQRTFQFGKEIGFCNLNLRNRAVTSSLLRAGSFEQVLNHSKAIYFSVALLMNRNHFTEKIRLFFQRKEWSGEAFLDLMKTYGASPEMFYHRLTNVLPKFFDLKKIFFTRFVNNPETDYYEIDRELHLDNRHHPHRNELREHYCRRWVAVSILNDLKAKAEFRDMPNCFLVAAQRVRYYNTNDEYLCWTIARSAYPTPNRNVSVTLGLLINDELRSTIQFWNDPAIAPNVVNKTCERCAIENCDQRVARPLVIERSNRRAAIKQALADLLEE